MGATAANVSCSITDALKTCNVTRVARHRSSSYVSLSRSSPPRDFQEFPLLQKFRHGSGECGPTDLNLYDGTNVAVIREKSVSRGERRSAGL